MKKPLFLILKKKYFDQILTGEKTKEYRLVKPFFVKKLIGKNYSSVVLQNGYSKHSRRLRADYLGYEIELLKHEFFGESECVVFAIKLANAKQIR